MYKELGGGGRIRSGHFRGRNVPNREKRDECGVGVTAFLSAGPEGWERHIQGRPRVHPEGNLKAACLNLGSGPRSHQIL